MKIQHNLAVAIANLLKQDEDSKEDKLLLVYGIEVFLNEFLKLACAWFLALFMGILPEVIFATVEFLLLRHYAGGKHFESNAVCFSVSILSMILPAFIGKYIDFEIEMLVILNILVCLFLIIYAPLNQKKLLSRHEKCARKILSIVIYGIAVIVAKILGGAQYFNIVWVIGVIEVISIL